MYADRLSPIISLSRPGCLKASGYQVRGTKNPFRESAANLSQRTPFQALPNVRDLRFRNMESFQGFRERLNLESLGGKRSSLVQWLRIEFICAVALHPSPDHIGSVS